MAASGGGKAGPAAESAAADALFGLSWSDPRFPPQELSAHNALFVARPETLPVGASFHLILISCC
eukprot:m.43893 g.43893  ORF g.43893 m.43893 type:complete len:65 (+) comp14863_c0_seq1:298-492(+)